MPETGYNSGQERQYTEIPEEQKGNISLLENKTDEIYRLRLQLVDFYKTNRHYFKETEIDGVKKRATLEDVSQLVMEKKDIGSLINRERVDRDSDKKTANIHDDSEKELAREAARDQVFVDFEQAAMVYNDLKNQGGVWAGHKLTEEDKEIRDYYRMRWGEFHHAIRIFDDTENQIKRIEEKLEYIRGRSGRNTSEKAVIGLIKRYNHERKDLHDKLLTLVDEHPEAYLYAMGRQIQEMKAVFDEYGNIIETPYVKTKIRRTMDIIESGRPVFVHGELGSGKTEFAKHLCRKYLSEAHLKRWEKRNPRPKQPVESIDSRETQEVRDIIKTIKPILNEWVKKQTDSVYENEGKVYFKGHIIEDPKQFKESISHPLPDLPPGFPAEILQKDPYFCHRLLKRIYNILPEQQKADAGLLVSLILNKIIKNQSPEEGSKAKQIIDLTKIGFVDYLGYELSEGELIIYGDAGTTLGIGQTGGSITAHPEMVSVDKELEEWKARRKQEAEPLMIYGHKNLEKEEIVAQRTVSRTTPPEAEEQVRSAHKKFEDFSERFLREKELQASQMSSSDKETYLETAKRELETIWRPAYLDAFFKTMQSPVEAKTLLGPMLKAMKEGKPVIIDEINGIPHHTLIIMNDLLLHRAGDLVITPFSDIEPFKVQEGYCVLATGNYKPEDGEAYIGRQRMDAAFLSRFGLIAYDYLPMNKDFEPLDLEPQQQREKRAENELHQMLVARILDKDLSVTLPEESMRKLRNLATVARNLQNIFSGETDNEGWYATIEGAKVKPQDVLKENVLSIRHLIPIIERWKNDGFVRELDDYLFLEYVNRSKARPMEMAYLYHILNVQGGFFQTGDYPAPSDKKRILSYPIDEKMYRVDRATGHVEAASNGELSLRTYSPKEVIEELFGLSPARQKLPDLYTRREQLLMERRMQEERIERERLLRAMRGSMYDLTGQGFTVFKEENE